MIGQGSPHASRARIAHRARQMLWAILAALMVFSSLGLQSAAAAETTMRLRIAWGGGTERTWHGSIRLSAGSFSELRALGIEANEPGSIWLAADGIRIREPGLRAYDGVDVLVTADLDATLTVSLADDSSKVEKTFEIPLRELADRAHNSVLDSSENRLFVTRSAGDRLRVVCHRENLVFAPGEMFKFELAAHLVDGTSEGFHYNAAISSGLGGQRVWADEYEAGPEGTSTTVTIRVPESEGVYDLTLSAVPSRLRARLYPNKPLAQRKVQFVVLENRAPADPSEGNLARVAEINPVQPRWWKALGNIPVMAGLRVGPLGNGESAPWEHPTLGPMIQLGPNGRAPNISWEAYPLPVNKPGYAHVVELEYPSDVPQAMGISIVEPNSAGAVMPIGLDSGVYISHEEAENTPELKRHRVVFWPRTKAPLLLITNRRHGSRAVYGKIRISTAAPSQFPTLPLTRAEQDGMLGPMFDDSRSPGRLWAGYLDRPLFAENFSSPEAFDPSSRRSLDDWTTMYRGGLRLVRYLKYVGYGGLMMSVYADGSTIYPSQYLEPTPRYDTGVFFGTAQDPMRKDALELLFRLFDREGLTFVPGLNFASPLPELEALRRSGDPATRGIEWIGADGATWRSRNPARQGLAPYYNLLDERVQAAMLNVVRELVSRYSAHPSFGGLALQLSADGYAQLPGDDWGFDDATVARFEAATGTRVPGEGALRFAERAKYLTGPGREAWLGWRASVVEQFHRKLASEIAAVRPNAKLYLAGGTMLKSRRAQFRLRPTLPKRALLDETLLELGIEAEAYRDDDNLVLLRPQHLRPSSGPLHAQASDMEINAAPEMDRLFADAALPATLFYHEPQKARLTSFDLKSPFGPANTYMWMVSQMSPSGDRNRRRFIHALAALDAQTMFDGGWLLPLGQEGSLREVLSVYRQLPNQAFETLAGETQPVTIRRLVHDGQTYVYLVNDSPWKVAVSLGVGLPPGVTMERLGDSAGIGPLESGPGGARCTISLEPYDLVAARFSATTVRLVDPRVSVSEDVRRGLQARIQDLGARVAALNNPQPMAPLENWGFELPQQGEQIVGWTASAAAGSSVAIDTAHRHDGEHSIRLTGGGPSASIVSAPFDPPRTGRIAIDLWLRTGRQGMPSVRIALEGEHEDGKFNPYGMIPPVGPERVEADGWVHYHFPIDDVPSEGLSALRVRLDLLSAGEVWLDEIRVFDLPFTPSERFELSKLITLASVKLESGQYADCLRLLEGYWPQFLVANVPLAQTAAPIADKPAEPPARGEPESKPDMLESLKEYLPRFPRR